MVFYDPSPHIKQRWRFGIVIDYRFWISWGNNHLLGYGQSITQLTASDYFLKTDYVYL